MKRELRVRDGIESLRDISNNLASVIDYLKELKSEAADLKEESEFMALTIKRLSEENIELKGRVNELSKCHHQPIITNHRDNHGETTEKSICKGCGKSVKVE